MDSTIDGKALVDKMQEVLSKEIPFITYSTYIAPLNFESLNGTHIIFKWEYFIAPKYNKCTINKRNRNYYTL